MSQGGVRPGAGRKCLPARAKKVPVTFSVSQTAKKMLAELRNKGVAINDLVEDYIQVLHYDNINCGFKIK